MDQLRSEQLFRYSETARMHSNASLDQLKEEIETDPEPTDIALISLARIVYQLRIRQGDGNYPPAA